MSTPCSSEPAPPIAFVPESAWDVLKEKMQDWCDFDSASLEVGKVLGVFSEASTVIDHKPVFWTNNPL
eukprot:Cvel_15650.t1-p1 / transcript=Cvel_15650.t1 / gene=Cvel_15650 / organism=Chromera_velia_CCMP2878 / gene_product=hypothetical protein / transcript_product=hypothetical protein / location=Cvel_scaffold1168:120-321(-) / protein_length=67 / sequence_SO=supercontig / SO=protein_coding / is_pseudo=false